MSPPPIPPDSHRIPPPPWLAEAHTIRRVVQIDVHRVVATTLFWGMAFALLLAIPFMLYYRSESHAFKDAREGEKERVIRLASEIAQRELDNVLSDLRFLHEQNEMREFLLAFAARGAFTLHADVLRGVNTHHRIEALFKALALALRRACRVEGEDLPSTKGTL